MPPHLSRQLTWDERDHIKVVTQLHGSVWPRVWPFCVGNLLVQALVYLLKQQNLDVSASKTGHLYMGMVMSFLVVTRVKITYDRYMADSTALQEIYKCVREIVSWTCHITGSDKEAQQWRHDVALATLELLDNTMLVLDFRSRIYVDRLDKIPDTLNVHKAKRSHRRSPSEGLRMSQSHYFPEHRLMAAHLLTEACRSPVHAAWKVREVLMQQRHGLLKPNTLRHPCNEELRWLDFVGDYLKAFSVLENHMTTPIPFPMVQMTKTFLFVWLFSLPLTMPLDNTRYFVLSLLMIALITYGFVGLEFVACELTDCEYGTVLFCGST